MLDAKPGLASLDSIEQIRPIAGTDAIVVGSVAGRDVVVRKGEYAEGEAVIYIAPNAALPLGDHRFAYLAPRGRLTIDGIEYHVIHPTRLHGHPFQGIVFPATKFPEAAVDGVDLDQALGIRLWEAPGAY